MLYFVILGVLTVFIGLISSKSGLLRNEVFNIENLRKLAATKHIKNIHAAYSLGRTQLVFWTVIVTASFIYVVIYKSIAMHTIVVPALDGVNLALLGISAATTIAAKVIDGSQQDDQGDIIPQQDRPSKNFFTDLISDEKGVSVHRLQNVIWTIVVGAIYIWYVAINCALPDQTTITLQLLSLMGISTGAYLGLKTLENKANPASDTYKNIATTDTADSNTPSGVTGGTPGIQSPAEDTSNSAQHDY